MVSSNSPGTPNTPELELFHPREKGRWQKLGVAFRNRDGSFSMILEYMPVGTDGPLRIVARPYESRDARDARDGEGNREAHQRADENESGSVVPQPSNGRADRAVPARGQKPGQRNGQGSRA
ncbi:MAG: hypothetical protein Q8O67_11200 [Deltaproteobacteria bacterium]|nr:hypothetical protein [Deltaproteobacteria bacterium]